MKHQDEEHREASRQALRGFIGRIVIPRVTGYSRLSVISERCSLRAAATPRLITRYDADDGPDNCLGQDLGPYPDAQTTRLHHRHHVGTKRPWMPNGDVVVSFPYRNVEKQISSLPI